MDKKKPQKAIISILLSGVLGVSTYMYSTPTDVARLTSTPVMRSHQSTKTTMQSNEISLVSEKEAEAEANGNSGNPDIPGAPNPNTKSNVSWLEHCKRVHNAWGAAGFTYGYGNNVSFTHDGITETVRVDCSGYVGYCLYTYGKIIPSPTEISSKSDLTKYGLTPVTVDQLQAGDIVAEDGHIEIYLSDDMVVYNWGGVNSTSKKYEGVSDPYSVDPRGNSSHHKSQVLRAYRLPDSMLQSSGSAGETGDKIVYIDAGHGCKYRNKDNPGPYGWATAGAPGEPEFNDKIATLVKEGLRKEGFTVYGIEQLSLDGVNCTREDFGNSGRGKAYLQSNCTVMIQMAVLM